MQGLETPGQRREQDSIRSVHHVISAAHGSEHTVLPDLLQ